jgi:hypothetical protein
VEIASERRADSEHVEKLRRHAQAGTELGGMARFRDGVPPRYVRGQLRDGRALLRDGEVVGPLVGEIQLLTARPIKPEKTVLFLVRQRPEQERVQHGEHRRVQSDAERERDHRSGCEAGRRREMPEREPQCAHGCPPGIAADDPSAATRLSNDEPDTPRTRSGRVAA